MMMFDIAKMMSQAKKVQDQMVKIQDELASSQMEGQSADGKVTISCNGKFENWNVQIDPSLNDSATIQAGVQQALEQLTERIMSKTQDKMSALTQGLNIPGLKLPF
jgi:DNA-binding YbaB/EbfC family protein